MNLSEMAAEPSADPLWFYRLMTNVLMAEYSVLFVLGVCGNIWVLSILARIFCQSSSRRRTLSLSEHLYVYLAALSTADMLVLSVIPFVLAQWAVGNWDFGLFACKYFWTIENVNKLLSVALLTAMSVDRFCAVVHPFKVRFLRRKTSVGLIILGAAGIVVVALSPVMIYSNVQSMVFMDETDNMTQIVVRICAFDELVGDKFLYFFIGYLFALGYVLPASVIVFCYSRLLLFVRAHSFAQRKTKPTYNSIEQPETSFQSRANRRRSVAEVRSHQLMTNLSNSVKQVVLFYFACWTPYWVFVLLPLLKNNPAADSGPFVVLHMFVHTLPYVNSAANWIFYALLNRQLVESSRKMSVSVAGGASSSHHQQNGRSVKLQMHSLKRNTKSTAPDGSRLARSCSDENNYVQKEEIHKAVNLELL